MIKPGLMCAIIPPRQIYYLSFADAFHDARKGGLRRKISFFTTFEGLKH